MALTRIQVATASSGTLTSLGSFPSNPCYYDPKDEADVTELKVLHGSSIWQKRSWDDRIRVLRWEGNLVSSSYVSSLYTYFKSIEGKVRWFHFNDIATINLRWPTASTTNWKKARVITVKAIYTKGGSLKYDTLEIWIQPEK